MPEIIENAHYGKGVPCPFCGELIFVWIGGKCGKEQDGTTSINHWCPSGLCIEMHELGQDKGDEALAALKKRSGK